MEESASILLAIAIIFVPAIIVFAKKIFIKAGLPGHTAVIPIYNGYKLFDIAGQGSAFFLIFFIQLFGFFNRWNNNCIRKSCGCGNKFDNTSHRLNYYDTGLSQTFCKIW